MNPEEFSELMQKAYEEALQKADEIINEAKVIKSKALQELEEAKIEGYRIAEEWLDAQKHEIKEQLREEVLSKLIMFHLENGRSTDEITEWFQVEEDFITGIKLRLNKFETLVNNAEMSFKGNTVLRYEDMGRGGNIYFEDGQHRFKLWWEFGGGEVIAIVEIPTSEEWESRTGLPLEKMPSTIKFIGDQILNDQFSGSGYYTIADNALLFYKK